LKATPARKGTIDLHVHSNVSDGLLSPVDLATRAARAGVKTIALADHDALDGLEPLRAAAGPLGVTVIPAIELTARVTQGAMGTVHLLGFALRPSAKLEDVARRNRLAKRTQIDGILRRLAREDQIHLGWDEVATGRGPDAYVGRNQVASLLVQRGHAKSYRHAFQRFLDARRVPAADVVEMKEALEALRDAGAIVALAHPTHHDIDQHLRPLLDQGLDAIEAYRPHATGGLLAKIEARAVEHRLLVTGGSDWHGHHPDPPLGSWLLEAPRIEAFLDRVRLDRSPSPGL
jgi:3',5'-nucleoside bisphosphate phosphatase